jgi:glycosyltransferase involved in cell wall biosynthesis
MKISIITVSYNSEKFIESCIRSVKDQSYKNLEHIIIDGASTDNTLNLLNLYKNTLTKIVSEKDKGIYDAMNKGLNISNGDIVGFLNSDDFYSDKNVIAKVMSLFKKDPSLDACYSDLVYTNQNDTTKIVRYWKSNKFTPGSFKKAWYPPHPTLFVRKSIYEKLGGFDLSYSIASDVDLMMRFFEVNRIKVRYVQEVWVKMRLGGKSNKNLYNIWRQNWEIICSMKKNGLSLNFFSFFIYKAISRLKQFIVRPKI